MQVQGRTRPAGTYRVGQHARDAKIANAKCAIGSNEHIGCLQIAMEYMLIVQVLERHAKLRQIKQHGRVIHGLAARTVGLDFGVEIAALIIVQLDAQTVYRSRQGDATRT